MFKTGLSKINLKDALFPQLPIREPIEAVSAYFENDETSALWIVLDFMDFNKLYTDTIRTKISEDLGLSQEKIHVLTTHNHGGGTPSIEILAKLCSKCAVDAKDKAIHAKIRYARTESDRQLNILRRLYIPEIEGVSTLYFGACEKNMHNSLLFKERVISELREGRICNYIGEDAIDEVVPFAEGDKELFVLQFVSLDGALIGSIVRFASHAVTCNREGSYSSDYPYYVRAGMETEFGGICMFLNGPCAEIAPSMHDKFDGSEKTLGKQIANLAIEAIGNSELESIYHFADDKHEIMLPVRKEVIDNFVSIESEMPDSIPDKRRHLEKIKLKGSLPFLREKYSEGESVLGEEISVQIGLLQLNDITFLAFPGETFYKTGDYIKKSFAEKRIITVTEHERTVMYLPPEEDFKLGGYESTCKLTASNSESVLREKVLDYLKKHEEGKKHET